MIARRMQRNIMRVLSISFHLLIYLILLQSRATPTTYNHQTGRFKCDDLATDVSNTDPNFRGILPATNKNESVTRLREREYNILAYYASIPLPAITSSDDYINPNIPPQLPTNPRLNSRTDVNRITNRYISRILLGCYNNTDIDQIFLEETTRPFSLSGSSSAGICPRDGDYDFAAIDLVQLLYVAREYPNSMPMPIYNKIRDTLLSINGTINTGNTYTVVCQIDLLGFMHLTKTVEVVDTENHVLQTQISRYLSNQLLLEVYPDNPEYNNTANGNTIWLLQYLSTLVKDYFYEYNSRPYQLFAVKALLVLHSYAMDEKIVLVTEMILDIITSYSAIQMNAMRRFVPFRRQPAYLQETLSWKGDDEYYRIAILVGNYHTFRGPTYTIPAASGKLSMVTTIASKYRINDFTYQLFFRGHIGSDDDDEIYNAGEYFISNHQVAEMYYSTPHVLISAGGHETFANPPKVTFPNRFCLFPSCPWHGGFLRKVLEYIYSSVEQGEHGWSRPTTIVPSNEQSDDMLDMIRFQGHRSSARARVCRNLCVGPNFACGLQLSYGNVVEPILNECSIVNGNWRFIDFTRPNCLDYGYYMAVYSRTCSDSTCHNKADTYGIIEISERINTLTFETFQQMVLSNNPDTFSSNGVQNYRLLSGRAIEFEIDPRYEYESQIIRVEGIDRDSNDLVLDTRYRNWPNAWSSKGSFQSMGGRWTFDSSIEENSRSSICQRCIFDATDPLNPKRIITNIPQLKKHPMVQQQQQQSSSTSSSYTDGHYFDDSGSVLDHDSIQSIQFHYNTYGVTGFRMIWRHSGLQSTHGYVPAAINSTSLIDRIFGRLIEYDFDSNEYIVIVGIGTTSSWLSGQQRRINRFRMVSNHGGIVIAGYGTTEDIVYNQSNIISFYGRASDYQLYQLGVISMDS